MKTHYHGIDLHFKAPSSQVSRVHAAEITRARRAVCLSPWRTCRRCYVGVMEKGVGAWAWRCEPQHLVSPSYLPAALTPTHPWSQSTQ